MSVLMLCNVIFISMRQTHITTKTQADQSKIMINTKAEKN